MIKKTCIGLARSHPIHLFIFFCTAPILFASQPLQNVPQPAIDREHNQTKVEPKREHGLLLLDYEVIDVPGNEPIDLLGLHYLNQLNDWLYFGLGIYAPLTQGDYGGFMTFDFTLHAQQKIYDDLFINAGASLGGGGGGSNGEHSRVLSGTGGFVKSYIGLGYAFEDVSVGVNYAYFRFTDAQINSSQLNVFIQKPLSYSIASYADSGRTIASDLFPSDPNENIFTFEANNIFQIDPTGTDKETINTVSLQFSHFFTDNQYLFFAADIGYKGIPIYNQALGGVGHRFAVSPRVNLYGQLGVGSGGYSPDKIDTGPGLLVYPKLSLEYLASNEIGLSLSGGYLVAPLGTSKNYTAGAAVNYHISAEQKRFHGSGITEELTLKGLRVNAFTQTEFNVEIGDEDHHSVHMLSAQLDTLLNDHWYFATQVSVAYNAFRNRPGYGELLAGVGVQNRYFESDRFQNFFQILIGTNIYGIIYKPSIATNYSLSDNYALYAQLGMTRSVNNSDLYRDDRQFSTYNIGLGLTYRFSLP